MGSQLIILIQKDFFLKESSFGVGRASSDPSFWTEIGTIITTTANGTEEIEIFLLSLN